MCWCQKHCLAHGTILLSYAWLSRHHSTRMYICCSTVPHQTTAGTEACMGGVKLGIGSRSRYLSTHTFLLGICKCGNWHSRPMSEPQIPMQCADCRTPTFPVDTHIHRLAQRWGLTKGKTVEQTEADLKVPHTEVPMHSVSSHTSPPHSLLSAVCEPEKCFSQLTVCRLLLLKTQATRHL